MTNYAWNTTSITTVTNYDLVVGDGLVVGPSGFLASTDAACIIAGGGAINITVAGMVSGSSDGIRLGAVNGALGTGGGNSLIVLQGGSVSGTFRDGVSLSGNGNSLINSGVISGAFGISSGWFDTNTATNSTISNSGQILGVEAGIVAFQGNTTIDNSGLISSGDSLGLFDSSILLGATLGGICGSGQGVVITNSGEIRSASSKGYGIAIAGDATQILNSGSIDTNSIDANRAAVDLVTAVGEVASLTNTSTGHISSLTTAIQGDDGVETVINLGDVTGEVLLGLGNDVFDGRFGMVNGTIWGEGGNDLLRAGGTDSVLSGGDGSDRVFGGGGDDSLLGNAGKDTLRGGAGSDLLRGGTGRDTLTGGIGDDTFRFSDKGEAGKGVNRDVITDFQPGSDLVDLSAIDANTLLAGNQAFVFIGNDVFSGAGQIRFANAGGILSGDLNGDGVPDFQIEFSNHPMLTAADFIL